MLTKDRIGALLMLAFCGTYLALAFEINLPPIMRNEPFNAQTMPLVLGVVGVVISFLLLVSPGSPEKVDLAGYKWGLGVAMILLMVAYGFVLRPLGFILATSLFLIGGFVSLGERNPLVLILASVPLVFGFWALMNYGLEVYVEPLPEFLTGGSDV